MKKLGIRHQVSGISPTQKRFGFFAGAWRLKPGVSRGFTVLFATLIATLILGVGLAIFDIIFKEVSFATTVRDSNYAIYAADTGSECALYWDYKCDSSAGSACPAGNPSLFATSSANQPPRLNGAQAMCGGQDILPLISFPPTSNGMPNPGPTGATSTFTFYLNPSHTPPYCVTIVMIKTVNPESTIIISRGYNTCDANNPNRIERAYTTNY